MTVSDIRRQKARQLAESVGGNARFAERVAISDSQVSQSLGKNPTRSIGDRLARKIERAFGKPRGWLDKEPDFSPVVQEIAEALEQRDHEAQVNVLNLVKTIPPVWPAAQDELPLAASSLPEPEDDTTVGRKKKSRKK